MSALDNETTKTMNTISSTDIVFPVFGGELDKEGCFIPKDLYGTAFYIKNNFFVTCAHTITNVKQHSIIALGFQNENNLVSYKSIVGSEIFESNDSGIIVCEIERAKPFRWLSEQLVMLTDVISTGFPFGYDSQNRQLNTRSFKGHINMVGHYQFLSEKPAHYELSYMCPKGISGAPLLYLINNEIVICGMTIGSEKTEIIVSTIRESEQIEGESKIKIYQTSEAYHRGIAVQSESFFTLKSNLLGTTFREYLVKENLLII